MKFSLGISKQLFPILLVNFIGILGYSIVIPILIFMVQDMGGNGFIYGFVGATYPFFQFIGAPILGKLSDAIGRKKVLVLSQAGTFLAWSLFIIALMIPKIVLWEGDTEFTGNYLMTLPLVLLFLARAFDGFTGGNVSVANAYLSDISTDENRNSNFGKMGASTSIGFVVGPALAGILSSTRLESLLPVMLAALISLLAIYVIWKWLPETNPCQVEMGKLSLRSFRRFFQVELKDCFGNETTRPINANFSSVIKIPGLPVLYGIYFLTFLAFSLFYAGLPLYASGVLQWTPGELGFFLAYSSLLMIVVQGPLLSFLNKRISGTKLIIIGAVFLTFSFLLLPMEKIGWLYTANTLLSIGNGLLWPSFLGLLSKAGSKNMQGAIQGYGNSMGSAASIFGLILGGTLFQQLEARVFTIAAFIFVLIILLVFANLYRKQKVKSDLPKVSSTV